jgi:eukaryotic-like serine/threonine-protein kinase
MPGGESRLGLILNGAYRLERLLGEGGMGTVYEAVHQRVPRRFAVKMLNPEILGNTEVFERFRREAEIASSLGSPHIVQVFDFNHAEDGSPYMVLELLDGHDLQKRVAERGRLGIEQSTRLLEQLSDALSVAHAANIVHRDLKPANIFLTNFDKRDDFVKILDFGISKVLHSSTGATRTGTVFGTPNYMSPEQAEGRQGEIDHRTDIFAVGAILYECLTGRLAFDAPTLVGTIYQVCHSWPPPIRSFCPEVPEGVERVLARAMAKQRNERQPDMATLLDEFRQGFQQAGHTVAWGGGQTMAATPPVHTLPAPGPVAQTTLSAVSSEAVLSTVAPAAAPHRGGSGKVIGLVGGAVGVAAVAVVAWMALHKKPEPAAIPVAASPAPAASVAPPAAPAAAAAPTVSVRLVLDPPDARVELDGLVTTANPLVLARSDQVHKIVVSAPGRTSAEKQLRATVDGALEVKLTAAAPAAPRPAAEPSRPAKARKRKVNLQEEW